MEGGFLFMHPLAEKVFCVGPLFALSFTGKERRSWDMLSILPKRG